jgi:hypothetical protein
MLVVTLTLASFIVKRPQMTQGLSERRSLQAVRLASILAADFDREVESANVPDPSHLDLSTSFAARQKWACATLKAADNGPLSHLAPQLAAPAPLKPKDGAGLHPGWSAPHRHGGVSYAKPVMAGFFVGIIHSALHRSTGGLPPGYP